MLRIIKVTDVIQSDGSSALRQSRKSSCIKVTISRLISRGNRANGFCSSSLSHQEIRAIINNNKDCGYVGFTRLLHNRSDTTLNCFPASAFRRLSFLSMEGSTLVSASKRETTSDLPYSQAIRKGKDSFAPKIVEYNHCEIHTRINAVSLK